MNIVFIDFSSEYGLRPHSTPFNLVDMKLIRKFQNIKYDLTAFIDGRYENSIKFISQRKFTLKVNFIYVNRER